MSNSTSILAKIDETFDSFDETFFRFEADCLYEHIF